MGRAFLDMLEHSYVSVVGALILAVLSCLFVPVKVSRRKRIVIGLLHFGAHLTSAIAFMMLLEIGLETCVRHKLLGTSGKIPRYQNASIILCEKASHAYLVKICSTKHTNNVTDTT